jgi:hypothetical protein
MGSMHEGQVELFLSQRSMQALWKLCMQGRYRSCSPLMKSIMQMTHLKMTNKKIILKGSILTVNGKQKVIFIKIPKHSIGHGLKIRGVGL